jgi:hypothetical protein
METEKTTLDLNQPQQQVHRKEMTERIRNDAQLPPGLPQSGAWPSQPARPSVNWNLVQSCCAH